MSGITLNVRTEREAMDSYYSVHWSTTKNAGIVPVRMDVDSSDGLILAEIWGLRHLLITKEILGNDRTGEGLTLNISCGAIKKLLLRKSSKKELIRHAIWLRTRFSDATIQCPKKKIRLDGSSSALGSGLNDTEPLLIVNEGSCPYDYINTGFGQVRISCHAVMRMHERLGLKNHAASWRMIRKILRTEKLDHASIPPSVLARKRKTYNEDALYLNSASGWQMVLVPVEQDYVLTTIYKQPEQALACAA